MLTNADVLILKQFRPPDEVAVYYVPPPRRSPW